MDTASQESLDKRYMQMAIHQAAIAEENGDVPIGCVIVHNGIIIAKAHNQREQLTDPTAHAEMIAITAAENYLGNWRLSECDIYVTVEPCVMCTGAILSSRIKRISFGAFDPKFGACGSIYNLAQEGKLNHKTKVYSGLLCQESSLLLQEFFRKKRANSNKL